MMIKVISKLMMEYGKKWVEVLKWAVWAYNMTVRKSTGYKPFYLKYGVRANLPIDMEIATYRDDKDSEVKAIVRRVDQLVKLHEKRVSVLEVLQFGYDRRRTERSFDSQVRKEPLKPGDKVLLWRSELDNSKSAKFEP